MTRANKVANRLSLASPLAAIDVALFLLDLAIDAASPDGVIVVESGSSSTRVAIKITQR